MSDSFPLADRYKSSMDSVVDVASEPAVDFDDAVDAAAHNEILDAMQNYCSVDLLKHIDSKHILKRLAAQVASAAQMPASTVLIAGLSVFASMASRRWAVTYQDGNRLPIGIYSVLEQPPATGKSRCLSAFQKPFRVMQDEYIAYLYSELKERDESDEEYKELNAKISKAGFALFITNSTAEGLDTVLLASNGYFSAVSSEQGLFDSLLGLNYGADKVNNNDTLLNGYDGGHVSSKRVTRATYSGSVVGGVCCFAQPGSIEKILTSSNGTGLAERFIMLGEPHMLGRRSHGQEVTVKPLISAAYANKCEFIKDVLNDPKPLHELSTLKLSRSGYDAINQYRDEIEPHLADGGKFSHVALRGAAGKIDMTILKLAANLHLLADQDEEIISDDIVKSAIAIANDLLESSLTICKDKGIMGQKAEFVAILRIFENGQRLTERRIIQSRTCVEPFKSHTGNKSDLIRQNLVEMCEQELLRCDVVGSVREYRLNQ